MSQFVSLHTRNTLKHLQESDTWCTVKHLEITCTLYFATLYALVVWYFIPKNWKGDYSMYHLVLTPLKLLPL